MPETPLNVAIIGTGYVGLVTGAALAHLGHHVVCVDNVPAKIEELRRGGIPIHEPGLAEMVAPLIASGSLRFTLDLSEAVLDSSVVFICVGTPMSESGAADTRAVEAVASGIGAAMDGAYRVIVTKSTVPIGSGDWVMKTVLDGFEKAHPASGFAADFDVVSNPEFLREGTAISDTFFPDRIVIGTRSERAIEVMETLYAELVDGRFQVPGLSAPPGRRLPVPFVVTDLTSAEMIKYASNSFLALKISFINEIAGICEKVGADVKQVAKGIGYDQRIGHRFLEAGLGWGGSCFRKDLSALAAIADQHRAGTAIIRSAIKVNEDLRVNCVAKLRQGLGTLSGKTIGFLGIAFKPNTDDLRDAPALTIARLLDEEGAVVKGYDPVAMDDARPLVPKVAMAGDAYELAAGCDALVLVTDWPQFRALDTARLRSVMRGDLLVDGRNMFDEAQMTAAGFRYVGFGR